MLWRLDLPNTTVFDSSSFIRAEYSKEGRKPALLVITFFRPWTTSWKLSSLCSIYLLGSRSKNNNNWPLWRELGCQQWKSGRDTLLCVKHGNRPSSFEREDNLMASLFNKPLERLLPPSKTPHGRHVRSTTHLRLHCLSSEAQSKARRAR